jgi:phosphatidylglycerol:prolipoprotein diacylglycerol transferase
MFPKIFSFNTPNFLKGIFPDILSINSYGLFIGIGILCSFYIILSKTKSLGLNTDKLSEMYLWSFAAAVIGGKLLFFLESPLKYLNEPALMLKNFGNGFVFYGSLLLVIPTLYFWLKKQKIPFWPFMDGVAFGGPVLHSFGRIGCFLAGCCHGKVCPDEHHFLGVIFSHPDSAAYPKNVPIYPTQLFDIGINLITLVIVYFVSKRQHFKGQLFIIYIALYALGRVVIENFRGDDERGFLFNGYLTYSQFIALILISLASIAWYILSKKAKNPTTDTGSTFA